MSDENEGVRLQKILARAGYGSRRACEDLISSGKVTVNGEVATLGQRAEPDDEIKVDGVSVSASEELVYYLLNKPIGYVTTSEDPQGRDKVLDLVPKTPRVFSVGRLDIETEGLLLLTNDGDLAFRLTHPSFGLEKEYLVEVNGKPSPSAIRKLREGVDIGDETTAPAKVSQVEDALLKIVIHEGKNRQVRRMCEAVGHQVTRLVRLRIGPISDRKLSPKTWRELTQLEIKALQEATVKAG